MMTCFVVSVVFLCRYPFWFWPRSRREVWTTGDRILGGIVAVVNVVIVAGVLTGRIPW